MAVLTFLVQKPDSSHGDICLLFVYLYCFWCSDRYPAIGIIPDIGFSSRFPGRKRYCLFLIIISVQVCRLREILRKLGIEIFAPDLPLFPTISLYAAEGEKSSEFVQRLCRIVPCLDFDLFTFTLLFLYGCFIVRESCFSRAYVIAPVIDYLIDLKTDTF